MTITSSLLRRRGEPLTATAPIDVRVLGPVEVAHALSMRRYAAELTDALESLDGVDPQRALAPSDADTPPIGPDDARRSLPVRALRRLSSRSHRRRAAARAHRLHGDVFHLVDQRDAPLISALPAVRTVQTVHDLLGIAEQPESAEADQMRSGLEQAGHLVAISDATRAEIFQHLDVDPARVTVIPNGIDDHFRPIPAARLEVVYDLLPPAQYRVLHVASNAQPRKNLATTIRVLHALRQQGLDAILVRAGAPLPAAEQTLAEDLGVSAQVAHCGYVSEDRLVELYNAADALLFPSTFEGFGWPPLEAMACGLPVVSSALPAVETAPEAATSDHHGDVALIAPPHDVDALTTHLASVLTNHEVAANLRAAGLAHAAGFSWDSTARAYLEVYRSLLAG